MVGLTMTEKLPGSRRTRGGSLKRRRMVSTEKWEKSSSIRKDPVLFAIPHLS
jgi:hypothetical protein